jgi:hypothetical protein
LGVAQRRILVSNAGVSKEKKVFAEMGAVHSPKVGSLSTPSAGRERRRHARVRVQSRFMLRWLECGDCHEELIRIEDVSRGGARLVVRMPLAEGEVIFVHGWEGAFQSRAEVRRVYIGHDGEPRLGISFMDAEPPEYLLFPAPKSNS